MMLHYGFSFHYNFTLLPLYNYCFCCCPPVVPVKDKTGLNSRIFSMLSNYSKNYMVVDGMNRGKAVTLNGEENMW